MLDRVSFFSDGLRLDGDLHIPDSWRADEPLPAVIACSGYQVLKVIHPARFARALVPHGYVVLGFDYRGFGRSDGERGRLVPQDQVRDVRSAISFLETRPEVDPQRIALLGWVLGGGVVLAAAAEDPRVRAVAACKRDRRWTSLDTLHARPGKLGTPARSDRRGSHAPRPLWALAPGASL
jgi:dienelactone hydrolase